MSRTRPIDLPNGTRLWFDKKNGSAKATAAQLEWLSAVEDIPLDDLLDEGLTQAQVLERLRRALGQGEVPAGVLERQRHFREQAAKEPTCRICSILGTECEGRITRHHFIPRWMMLMLDNYPAYAARRKCTIPACIGRHRDLHLDDDASTPKSIAQYMTDDERKFAQKMLEELEEQHPAVFKFIRKGHKGTYEMQLLNDYDNDLFATATLDRDEGVQYTGIIRAGLA
jgi:hypothetical protein